jgi:hypothetical protein
MAVVDGATSLGRTKVSETGRGGLSVEHGGRDIAILYLATAFGFFLAGGAMAPLMRAELAEPGLQFLSTELYNRLFTMHGTVVLLLYATPILFGFANYIVPLQIGAPDVAFPRLNAFSYWLFLSGGLKVLSGFLAPGGAADFGCQIRRPWAHGLRRVDPRDSRARCGRTPGLSFVWPPIAARDLRQNSTLEDLLGHRPFTQRERRECVSTNPCMHLDRHYARHPVAAGGRRPNGPLVLQRHFGM